MYLWLIMRTFAYMNRLIATLLLWMRRFSQWQINGNAIKPNYRGETECKHCGTVFEGNFCPRCGQSRKVSKVTKHGFMMAFIEAYPQLAGSYLHTLLELIFRPGYMVRDYFRGHRIPYAGPFKTFVITVSVYALFTHVIQPKFIQEESKDLVTVRAEYKEGKTDSDKMMVRLVDSIIAKDKNLSNNKWIGPVWKMVKEKANGTGTIYLFILVPVYALIGKMTFHKRLFGGRKLIYAEHFMVFTYLYAVDLFFTILCALAGYDDDNSYSLLFSVVYSVWMYKGLYGWKWRQTFWRMLPFLLWLLLFLILFSIVLLVVMLNVMAGIA